MRLLVIWSIGWRWILGCLRAARGLAYALTAGCYFSFYPFHNEGVVWLSGRLSSMAALCGLMAIHFSLTKKWPLGFVLAALCWFIGLFAYESIIVLPAVVVLFEWIKFRDVRRGVRSLAVWAVAGVVWLGCGMSWRVGLLPPYAQGADGRGSGWVAICKGAWPVFPAAGGKYEADDDPFCGGGGADRGCACIVVWRRLRLDCRRSWRGWVYVALEIGFLLALLPAVAFGREHADVGGRQAFVFSVLYVLSAGGRGIIRCCRGRGGGCCVRRICGGGCGVDHGNNRRWVFASRAAESALGSGAPRRTGRVVLVNAPDEWEGAYIFRNNFNAGTGREWNRYEQGGGQTFSDKAWSI